MAELKKDVVVVGGGPAGLAAALYCGRHRYDTVVLEKMVPGGQIGRTDRIENYPGIVRIGGYDLVVKLVEQATSFGAEIKNNSPVVSLSRQSDGWLRVQTDEDVFLARVVILTPGSDYRKLGVPGEEEFRQSGSGVSYCGTCDAPFFRGKDVVAIGGGNVAVEDTLHLGRFCRKVTMVHRRSEFRAEKILVEELLAATHEGVINVRYDSICTAIQGDDRVRSVLLKNVKTGQAEEIACDGVFVFVGMIPSTDFLKGTVDLDEHGFIKCDPMCLRTNVPGVFVAGDCRVGAAMQLATAIGDGVACAMFMKEYLRDAAWWSKR